MECRIALYIVQKTSKKTGLKGGKSGGGFSTPATVRKLGVGGKKKKKKKEGAINQETLTRLPPQKAIEEEIGGKVGRKRPKQLQRADNKHGRGESRKSGGIS